MTALNALSPTTAMLARAAAAPAFVPSVESAVKEADPTQAKYVVVEDVTGHHHAILFHHKLQHSMMVPDGMTAVSAGYVMIFKGTIFIPDLDSMTLNLGPKPEDKQLLSNLINA